MQVGTPQFLEVLSKFDNDLALYRNHLELELLQEESSANSISKRKLLNELDRVVSYTFNIEFCTYYKFRQKCMQEGYSIQEGINKLIENYVEDRLLIKED